MTYQGNYRLLPNQWLEVLVWFGVAIYYHCIAVNDRGASRLSTALNALQYLPPRYH